MTVGVNGAAGLLVTVLVLPVGALLLRGGVAGLRQLATDAELQSALVLTAVAATTATLITIVLGTPLAYLLA